MTLWSIFSDVHCVPWDPAVRRCQRWILKCMFVTVNSSVDVSTAIWPVAFKNFKTIQRGFCGAVPAMKPLHRPSIHWFSLGSHPSFCLYFKLSHCESKVPFPIRVPYDDINPSEVCSFFGHSFVRVLLGTTMFNTTTVARPNGSCQSWGQRTGCAAQE